MRRKKARKPPISLNCILTADTIIPEIKVTSIVFIKDVCPPSIFTAKYRGRDEMRNKMDTAKKLIAAAVNNASSAILKKRISGFLKVSLKVVSEYGML